MQRKMILTTLVVLVVLGVATNHLVAREPDQIRQSFERELNREPSPPAKTRRDSIDTDELYSIVNSVHWTRRDPEVTEITETIARGTDDEE